MLKSLCALAAAGVVSTSTFAQCNSVLLLEQTSTAAPSSPNYGASVAMDGNIAVIGQESSLFPASPGLVDVLDLSTGTLLRTLYSNAGVPADGFGASVALHGDHVLVGSFLLHTAYTFDVPTGSQIHTFTAPSAPTGALFGRKVAINNDFALVAAPLGASGNTWPGTVYVYSVATGELVYTLRPSDSAANDQFGNALAIAGNTAVIGAPLNDSNGINAGAVYVFDLSTGTQVLRLVSDDIMPRDQFGAAVAIDADRVLVSAPYDDIGLQDVGSAYLFDLLTGTQLAKITVPNAPTNARFGESLDLSGDLAILGASHLPDPYASTGAAAVLNVATGQALYMLSPPNPVEAQTFGTSVSLQDGVALIGAPGSFISTGPYYGAAFLYEVPPCTPACQTDLNDDHTLDFSDVQMFLNFYSANDPAADFNTDGLIDFFDALDFLNAFAEGCTF